MGNVFNQPNWKVEGNVYQAGGDINIGATPTKDELITALRQLQQKVEAAELPSNDDTDELKSNVELAVKSADRSEPNKERIVEKLSTAQKVIDKLKESVPSALALGVEIGKVLLAAKGLLL